MIHNLRKLLVNRRLRHALDGSQPVFQILPANVIAQRLPHFGVENFPSGYFCDGVHEARKAAVLVDCFLQRAADLRVTDDVIRLLEIFVAAVGQFVAHPFDLCLHSLVHVHLAFF